MHTLRNVANVPLLAQLLTLSGSSVCDATDELPCAITGRHLILEDIYLQTLNLFLDLLFLISETSQHGDMPNSIINKCAVEVRRDRDNQVGRVALTQKLHVVFEWQEPINVTQSSAFWADISFLYNQMKPEQSWQLI